MSDQKEKELSVILEELSKTKTVIAESAAAIRTNTAEMIEQREKLNQILDILQSQDEVDLLDVMARFVAALEQRHRVIIVVDRQYYITWVNPATRAMFGYRAGELVGRPLSILIPDRFHDNHHGHFVRFMVSSDPMRLMGERGMEIWGVTKNGIEFEVNVAIGKQLGMFVAVVERT